MKIHFPSIDNITDGRILQISNDLPVRHVMLDSRKPILGEDVLFLAHKGKNHDSHIQINSLYEAGIKHFLVEEVSFNESILASCPEANFILVNDSIYALQQLAIFVRERSRVDIIALTGSNGKTIVKEWLSKALSEKYSVVKSPYSYNSQIGVPLSVLGIKDYHNVGVFEAGISTYDEMEKLEKIIKPNIGLFLNIGPPHSSGFESTKEKIIEKSKLFKDSSKIIYCSDHKGVHEVLFEEYSSTKELIPWSYSANNNSIYKINKEKEGSLGIEHTPSGKSFDVGINTKNSYTLENIIHTVITMLEYGFTNEEVNNIVPSFDAIPMRLEQKQGKYSCLIIDDSYNNDLLSFKVALDYMDQQNINLKKTIILTDFIESNLNPDDMYKEISEILLTKQVDRVIGIGQEIQNHKDYFNDLCFHSYETTKDFIDSPKFVFDNELILVKGCRKFKLEQIIDLLQEKKHQTRLEISLKGISENLNWFRSILKPETKVMVMAKALSYGASGFETSKTFEHNIVDYIGVAYVDEGIRLRNHNILLPIMVTDPKLDSLKSILEYNLEPAIYSLSSLKQILVSLSQDKLSLSDISLETSNKDFQKLKIHIKINSGMNRFGFKDHQIDELVTLIKDNPMIQVESIYSHLASADDPSYDKFTLSQLRYYEEQYNRICKEIGYKPLKHILATNGVLRFPEYQFDMVRLGIGIYGVGVIEEYTSSLTETNTFKTKISQINQYSDTEYIGYGCTEKVKKGSIIGTIPVGYADGFRRSWSNGKMSVVVNGVKCPTVGTVCMDSCMIDVSNVEAKEGDEVIIFGPENPLCNFADQSSTIPHEILTQVGQRVTRVYTVD